VVEKIFCVNRGVLGVVTRTLWSRTLCVENDDGVLRLLRVIFL